MKLIDSHAHVLKEMYQDKLKDIFNLCKDMEVLNIGIDWETSKECVQSAKDHKNFFAVIGIHPTDSEKYEIDIFDKLEKLYIENKQYIVAIGETGIDNKYQTDKDKQILMFEKHIELAQKHNLPIIIHNREAFEEVKPIIDKYPNVKFLMHSWTGNVKQMKDYISDNMWFSFSGIVTFNSAKDIAKCLDIVPKDKVLIETDCPYLTPVPFRGKENDPTKVIHVATFISEKWNTTTEEVVKLTYQNTIKLFKI